MKRIINISILTFALLILSCSFGAERFNKMAMNDAKNDKDFLPYLQIKKGEIIGVIGAGGGYYSVKLAKATGEMGKVYSVDINPESIAYIKKYVKDNGVNNIQTISGTTTSSNLKDSSVDTIFLRNTYHDIHKRVTYFNKLKSVLKPGGRIIIIDYDTNKLGFLRKLYGHSIDKEIINKEMTQAGYHKVKSYSFLKKQSLTIFEIQASGETK